MLKDVYLVDSQFMDFPRTVSASFTEALQTFADDAFLIRSCAELANAFCLRSVDEISSSLE